LLQKPELHLFSVFDGHGLDGQTIVRSLKQLLPKNLEEELFLNGFKDLPKSLVDSHNKT
jgi:hypothetical protein